VSHGARPIRDKILNTRLVREQTPMPGRELIAYLTLTALIAIPAVFGLWQQNVYVRSRFEIEALRSEKLVLQERYQCLNTERSTLEALPRIAAEARRYGLVPRDEARAAAFIGTSPRRAPDASDSAPATDRRSPRPGRTAPAAAPASLAPPL